MQISSLFIKSSAGNHDHLSRHGDTFHTRDFTPTTHPNKDAIEGIFICERVSEVALGMRVGSAGSLAQLSYCC